MPLNKLSSAQAAQVCGAELALFGSLSQQQRDRVCLLQGNYEAEGVLGQAQQPPGSSSRPSITDAALQAACASAYERCLSALSPPAGAPYDCAQTVVPAQCTATVDTFTACVDDYAAYFDRPWPSCATLTVESVSSFSSAPNVSGPSCAQLHIECPGPDYLVILPLGA
jgi:hypothetical protein